MANKQAMTALRLLETEALRAYRTLRAAWLRNPNDGSWTEFIKADRALKAVRAEIALKEQGDKHERTGIAGGSAGKG